MDISVGRQGVLEEDLLLLTMNIIVKDFGDYAGMGGTEGFNFVRSEVDSVEGFSYGETLQQ